MIGCFYVYNNNCKTEWSCFFSDYKLTPEYETVAPFGWDFITNKQQTSFKNKKLVPQLPSEKASKTSATV